MLVSSLVTAALVALVLFVHLRSLRVLVLLTANIVAATIVAFGIASLTVGHLNAATAFLGAIIAGNGVNYGILLVARYLEERRANEPSDAMARAIAGTIRPTLDRVARRGDRVRRARGDALQGLRRLRDDRRRRHAGVLARRRSWCCRCSCCGSPPRARATESPVFGRVAVTLFGVRRPAVACAIGGVFALASIAITVRYVAHDPFEYDMTKLRSDAPEALATRHWMKYVNDTFGRGLVRHVAQHVHRRRRSRAGPGGGRRARGRARARPASSATVQSIDDAVPPDQAQKLVVLAKIRDELDEAVDDLSRRTTAPSCSSCARPMTSTRSPPPTCRRSLHAKLAERDGRIGYLVAVTPGPAFDEWNGRDLVRFSTAIRAAPACRAAAPSRPRDRA